jgi:DNA-binding GntR family transcriptional regulator
LVKKPTHAGLLAPGQRLLAEPSSVLRLCDDPRSEPGRMRVHIAEHRMIYEAVVEGDLEAAELYARQHIRRVHRYMTLADQAQGDE